jgi:altronate hydrolase
VKPALVISELDNVATALERLEAGRTLTLGPGGVVVRATIPPGHKLAIADIPTGAPVVKYGSPIGLATADIAAGDHVHVHNLASSRGRGDLAPGGPPRLAEPADAASVPGLVVPAPDDPQAGAHQAETSRKAPL